MKPWSSTGLTSRVAPWSAANWLIASTSSRDSSEMLSAISLEPLGAIGRVVKLRHLACESSITLMVSLHTMKAPASSENCGLLTKPRAV
jgi:hypothetical protein